MFENYFLKRIQPYIDREFKRIQDQMKIMITENENRFAESLTGLDNQVKYIEGREEEIQNGFIEVIKSVEDIEGREEEIQNGFIEVIKRIEDIEGREEWTRNRFAEVIKRIEDIEGREEWTRNRFAEVMKRIEDIEGREEWTRNMFTRVESQIQEMKACHFSPAEDICYVSRTYSQSGEDAIISHILKYLQISFEQVSYLDLGANHAKEMSNTYFFYSHGARGVLVEANPELIEELKLVRENDIVVNKAVAINGNEDKIDFYCLSGDGLSTINYEEALEACEINPEIYIKEKYVIDTVSINSLLETYFKAKSPTILSIDLEGIEIDVLKQIDFSLYRPTIIIVEDIPYSPKLVVGSKQNIAKDLLEGNGYIEYAFTGINAIYVDLAYGNDYFTKVN